MGESYILSHCTAVFYDIKPANLFRISGKSSRHIDKLLDFWNRSYNKFDIYFRLVAKNARGHLIFVYRSKRLGAFLSEDPVCNFLKALHYETSSIDSCLSCLKSKLSYGNFPHEIGCFLGYPFEDVEGFIKNKGQNYILSGYRKVYKNKEDKKRLFSLYDETRKLFMDTYEKRRDIGMLIK